MMETSSLDNVLSEVSKQLASLDRMARGITGRIISLSRKAEMLKVEVLVHLLEETRASQARNIGLTAVKQDGKLLGIGLGLAVAGSIVQGIAGKNDLAALAGGVSSFNGFLQGLGETRWAVSLDKQFIVVPRDKVFAGRTWVTWESFHPALLELKQKAIAGEDIGDLNTVINKLKHGRSTLIFLLVPYTTEVRLSEWHRITG